MVSDRLIDAGEAWLSSGVATEGEDPGTGKCRSHHDLRGGRPIGVGDGAPSRRRRSSVLCHGEDAQQCRQRRSLATGRGAAGMGRPLRGILDHRGDLRPGRGPGRRRSASSALWVRSMPGGRRHHSDRGRRGGLRVPPLLERCARCRRGSIRARKPDGERVAGASVLRGAVPDDVVGDAPSEGGPLTGQGPPKSRAHALVCEGVVQLPPGAAGLCSHCYGVGVDLDDLIEPRHVQDDPAIGQGRVTEGVREAASSKLDGGAGLVGHTHHAGNPSSRAVRRCLRRPRRRDSGRCRNRRGPWPTRTRCACPGCGPAGRCPSMPLARSGSGKPNGGL